MTVAYVELVRRIAAEKFPPAKHGPIGSEPFNVSALCSAAFGTPEKTRWTRIAEKPQNIRLDDAANLARALGVSFAGLIADCQNPSLQTLLAERLPAPQGNPVTGESRKAK